MPERKHNLTSRYERLEDQITADVLDSIAVHPRSDGRLHMPGEYSTDSRPPPHQGSPYHPAKTQGLGTRSALEADNADSSNYVKPRSAVTCECL